MEKSKEKMTYTKIIWIFVIGCIAGYIFEVSFYFLKHGFFLNKQGLLYGPFKPIYGFGCVIISLFLNFVKNKKNLIIFIYGSILGGVFEYACSLILQYFFKTRMWTYSHMGLDINGRVYLPYLPIWGLIALLWLKIIYPWFSRVIAKIPKKTLCICTIIISVFFIFNSTISTVAVWRMRARAKDVPATSKLDKFLDKYYTDEYILKRIPYLRIVD